MGGCFIEVLKCILCCHEEETGNGNYNVLPTYTSIPQPPRIVVQSENNYWSQDGSSSSPSYFQHKNPVGGGVENKSLSSTRHAFVNNSSAKRQQVTQSQKSSAPSPSTRQAFVNNSSAERQQVSQTQKSSAASPSLPFTSQSNSIDKLIKVDISASDRQKCVDRWLESSNNPQQSLSSFLKHLDSVTGEFVHSSCAKPQQVSGAPKGSSALPSLLSVTQSKSIDKGINEKSSASHKKESVVRETSKSPIYFKPPPLCPSGHPASSSFSDDSDDSDASKANYVCFEVAMNPVYAIPEDIKQLIKKDIAPQVLRKHHLTPSTYKDYFAAMLYAEDFYFEKWSTFCLRDVTLELHEASIYMKSSKNKNKNRNKNLTKDDEEENKLFVAFQYDSALGKRPFLLSRDFVHVRPSGTSVEPFTGILYRVVKSELVLAEFGDDFHSRHSPNRKYDVSFSFNRVCLKRSHQAIAAATQTLFRNFLFPVQTSRVSMHLSPPSSVVSFNQNLNKDQVAAADTISRLRYSPPYLIEGPLSVISTGEEKKLSTTGLVIKEAILKIYSTSPGCRILVNAPTNSTCDVLMRSLKKNISESEMFRANAAFRELDGVPYDILSSCPYKGECFTCPSLKKLKNFKVILSTYVSSFRLRNEGISAGHFSHIFMVDASSATEPETMVALVNLASEKTVVVISGATGNRSTWVRSDIARQYGLRVSYFERLLGSNPWCNYDPMFVARIQG